MKCPARFRIDLEHPQQRRHLIIQSCPPGWTRCRTSLQATSLDFLSCNTRDPRPTPANAGPSSGFVGGFAPHLQGPQQSLTAPNFLNRPITTSYVPPTNSYKPPNNPPPLANNRFQPVGLTSAAHPTGATAIRVSQTGSSQGQLLAALSKAPHTLSQVPHAISGALHGHNPGAPQYPSQQAAIIRTPPGGEFENIDNVQARPGEIIGDWDELITDIKATAEEVAEDYNEEDAIVPGFDERFKLRAWQVQGRHWMLARESGGKRGGILADDVSCLLLPQEGY